MAYLYDYEKYYGSLAFEPTEELFKTALEQTDGEARSRVAIDYANFLGDTERAKELKQQYINTYTKAGKLLDPAKMALGETINSLNFFNGAKPSTNNNNIPSYSTSGNGVPSWANQNDWEQATQEFTAGDPIVEAAAKKISDLQAKLDNPTYKAQLESIANEINGREDFSYDFSTDPMFQQMLASYSQMGKMASRDAMAKAAGLTGGYASSFAQSVGNQAYNQMLQEGYNNLPAYYQMALDAYTREGEALKDKYSILRDLDQTEYDRIMNDISLTASERDSAWAKELEKYGISTGLGQYKLGIQQSDAQHRESLARQAESDRLSMLASGYVQDASGNWIRDPEIEDAETLSRLVSQIEKAKENGTLNNFISSLDAEVQESGLLDEALQEAGLTRDSYGRLPAKNNSELLDELAEYGINVENVAKGTEDYFTTRNQLALGENYSTVKSIYDSYKQRTGKKNEKIEKLLEKYESYRKSTLINASEAGQKAAKKAR